MNSPWRTLRLALFVGSILAVLCVAGTARADLRERYASARDQSSAEDARIQMERILGADDDDPDVAADAGLWLGQYEYVLGRLESALGYFRHSERIAQDDALVARARFWSTHTANLLVGGSALGETSSVPVPAQEGDPAPTAGGPEARQAGARGRGPVDPLDRVPAYQVLEELAEGDARMRRGELESAVRLYLEAEGRARQSGRLGPLAYRAALAMARARKDGKKEPLFDSESIAGWDDELAVAPERGLIFAALRAGETVAAPREPGVSEFASTVSGSSDPGGVASRKWGDGAEGILEPNRSVSVRDDGPRGLSTRGGAPGEELFVIQLGAFGERERAREQMERFTSRGLSVRLERGTDRSGERIFRIRLGAASSREQAEALAQRVLEGLPYQLVLVEP